PAWRRAGGHLGQRQAHARIPPRRRHGCGQRACDGAGGERLPGLHAAHAFAHQRRDRRRLQHPRTGGNRRAGHRIPGGAGLRQQQAGWNQAQADGRCTPRGSGLAGEHRPGGGAARRLPLVRRASGSGKGLNRLPAAGERRIFTPAPLSMNTRAGAGRWVVRARRRSRLRHGDRNSTGSNAVLRKILAYRNLLFMLVLLNSTCFFLTDDKRAGVPYLQEIFLLFVVGATACLFVAWRWVYQSKTSLWIIFMGTVLPLVSAVLAYLNFEQPIVYGLFEERRFLQYLIFFPVLFL